LNIATMSTFNVTLPSVQ